MGEYTLLKIAQYLENGNEIKNLTSLPGTGYMSSTLPSSPLELPAYEEVAGNKQAFSRSTRLIYQHNNLPFPLDKNMVRWVVMNPPPFFTTAEIDRIYSSQFMRQSHPMYDKSANWALSRPVFSGNSSGLFWGLCFLFAGYPSGKVYSESQHRFTGKRSRNLYATS